jgi:hypothetical protein
VSISFLDTENLDSDYKFKMTNKFDQINILNTVINSFKVFFNDFKNKIPIDYIFMLNKYLQKYIGGN